MRFDHTQLIEDLISLNQAHLSKVRSFAQLPLITLNAAPAADAWSALQCAQHLNLSLDFYIPEISQQIQHTGVRRSDQFRSGLLGNYFAKSMWPSERMLRTKTLSRLVPDDDQLGLEVLEELHQNLHELELLLESAREVDLTGTRTSTMAGSWLKVRLGDAFRVVVYHNERHMKQAQRAIDSSYK